MGKRRDAPVVDRVERAGLRPQRGQRYSEGVLCRGVGIAGEAVGVAFGGAFDEAAHDVAGVSRTTALRLSRVLAWRLTCAARSRRWIRPAIPPDDSCSSARSCHVGHKYEVTSGSAVRSCVPRRRCRPIQATVEATVSSSRRGADQRRKARGCKGRVRVRPGARMAPTGSQSETTAWAARSWTEAGWSG